MLKVDSTLFDNNWINKLFYPCYFIEEIRRIFLQTNHIMHLMRPKLSEKMKIEQNNLKDNYISIQWKYSQSENK